MSNRCCNSSDGCGIQTTEHDSHGHNHGDNNGFKVKKEFTILIIYISTFLIANVFYYVLEDNLILYHSGIAIMLLVYLFSGYPIFKYTFQDLRKKIIFTENFLMTSVTIIAIIIGQYSEAAAIILFYRVGMFLEDWAVSKSRRSIESLLRFKVDYVIKIVNNKPVSVKAEDVEVGDIIEIAVGEKVPLDSIVIDGETTLDMKSLTGESIPKYVKLDDEMLAGSINLTTSIKARVLKIYSDSHIAKIINLVESAKENKATTEKFIRVFARYYTPAVFIFAILIVVVSQLFSLGDLNTWIYRALVVLVVSCPCALVISIPMGYFVSIGAATKAGVLIKGANYLEALTKVSLIAFDKTGTLTNGTFDIVDIKTNDYELLNKVAKYSMAKSNHPISKSIFRSIKMDIDYDMIGKYTEIAGSGVELLLEKKKVVAGTLKLLTKNNIDVPDSDKLEDTETIVYFAMDKAYIGKIVLRDNLRDDSEQAVENIRKMGIDNFLILSGDKKAIVESIANKLGIKKFFGELLPDEKATIFKEEMAKTKGMSIYIGDGINDAPVIALSDIGMSIADVSSDIALESADVIFMNPSINSISTTLKLAKKSRKIIIENIVFALGIKLLIIVLGLLGFASIYMAVFGDVGVTLLALLNALRLMRI